MNHRKKREFTEAQKLAVKNRPKNKPVAYSENKGLEKITMPNSATLNYKVSLSAKLREFLSNFNFTWLSCRKQGEDLSYSTQVKCLERRLHVDFKGKRSRLIIELLNHATKFKKLDQKYPFNGSVDRFKNFESLKLETIGKLEKVISE